MKPWSDRHSVAAVVLLSIWSVYSETPFRAVCARRRRPYLLVTNAIRRLDAYGVAIGTVSVGTGLLCSLATVSCSAFGSARPTPEDRRAFGARLLKRRRGLRPPTLRDVVTRRCESSANSIVSVAGL